MSLEHLDFSNQNLRDRSFRGQDLQGADFRGADIRGCDFRGAQLRGANFDHVRAGRSLKYFCTSILVTLIVALLAMNAISRMVYGAIAANDSAFALVLALHITSGLAGLATAFTTFSSVRSLLNRSAWMIAGAVSMALLGFFYIGTATGNNQTAAAVGALIGAGLGAIACWRMSHPILITAVTGAGAIASYGFAFLVGARAIALLSGGYIFQSLLWGLISLVYLGLTTVLLGRVFQTVRATGRTSFEQADLIGASFRGAKLGNTEIKMN